jgi:hypothetical protein
LASWNIWVSRLLLGIAWSSGYWLKIIIVFLIGSLETGMKSCILTSPFARFHCQDLTLPVSSQADNCISSHSYTVENVLCVLWLTHIRLCSLTYIVYI